MWSRVAKYARMVQLEHTLFALPFSMGSMLLAAGGLPPGRTFAWILLALISGRCFAMGMNRYADRHLDQRNPRTAERVLPGRDLGLWEVRLFLAGAATLLALAASRLPPLCLQLLPVALAVLTLYSYTKRFTWASHFVLGLCLSMAVAGSWIAVRGTLDAPACILAGAIVLWVAGFDVLYAGQDIDFDRATGLHSVPARLGLEASQRVARWLHAGSCVLLWAAGAALGVSWVYLAGIAVISWLVFYEHRIVAGGDLTRIQRAFFLVNVWVSFTFLVTAALEVLLAP